MSRKQSYTFAALAALFLATASAVAEQAWFVRTWQSDEGLPDNSVLAIDQTSDGFLWVATQTGLVRFDGVQFREFSTQAPGMAVDTICAMCADRKGRIWVAKDRGSVVCVEQGRVTEIVGAVTDGSDGRVRMLVVDREDAVWVSRKNGKLLRIKDGNVRAYITVPGLPPGSTCELAVDPGGCVWFLWGQKLGFIREEKVTVLAQAPFERICVARGGGVRLISDTAVATYTEGKGFSGQVEWKAGTSEYTGPTALLEDRAGLLWAGTRLGGLFCIEGNQSVKVRTSQQAIICLMEDAEGNIWIGTRGGGLKQVRPRIAELLTTGSGTQYEGIDSLCKDTQGHLWAVVWVSGAILRNAGQGWEPLTVRDGGTEMFAKCVAADPAGGVWIGTTGGGVFHWQDGAVTRNFCSTNGLTGDCIDAEYAPEPGELWLSISPYVDAPSRNLICCKDGALRGFPLPLGTGKATALARDGAGDFWAGTANGMLVRVRKAVLTNETPLLLADKLHPIRSLLATPDGSLWIGFAGRGLGRLKDGRFTSFRRAQGLHDDYVSQILSDGRGRLWLAGNRGISSVRIKDFDELEAGLVNQIQAVTYKQKDGLLALQASFNSCPNAFCDKDGALFFAMQSGVAKVYPDAIKNDPLPSNVVIDRVLANGEVVALYGGIEEALSGNNVSSLFELGQAGADLHLPSGRRQLEFRFTAPAFTMPENIRFKYQLQGVDKEWIEAGARRSALYSQIAPGRYKFRVIACNRDGVWNEQGASLDLTVPPLWWETVWFRIGGPLCAFGVVGCLVVMWLRRRQQFKIEKLQLQQAIERDRTRIAQDLHDDLGAGLTEVALLSEVVRRNRGKPDAVEAHSRRIFASSKEMTQALDEIVWSVNPANDTLDKLVAFVCEFAQAFLDSASIRCNLDVPAVVPDLEVNSQIRHQICMAVKECLANVIKHAGARTVTLSLRLEGRRLEITVEDDGVGFDPALVRDTTGTHDGLVNLKRRLTIMNGTCEIQSARGQGTRVRLMAGL